VIAGEEGPEAAPVHGRRRRNAGALEQRRRDVEMLEHRRDPCAGWNMTRPPCDERHVQAGVVEAVVIEVDAVLGQALAVITEEHRQGAIAQAEIVKGAQDLADALVHVPDLLVVHRRHVGRVGDEAAGRAKPRIACHRAERRLPPVLERAVSCDRSGRRRCRRGSGTWPAACRASAGPNSDEQEERLVGVGAEPRNRPAVQLLAGHAEQQRPPQARVDVVLVATREPLAGTVQVVHRTGRVPRFEERLRDERRLLGELGLAAVCHDPWVIGCCPV